MGAASNAAADAGLPVLPGLLHPDRWLLWLGLLFIASVYFFPTGVVGRLRNPAKTVLNSAANAPVFPIISGPESLIKARVTGFANVDAIMARLSVFLGRPEECQRRFSAFGR